MISSGEIWKNILRTRLPYIHGRLVTKISVPKGSTLLSAQERVQQTGSRIDHNIVVWFARALEIVDEWIAEQSVK